MNFMLFLPQRAPVRLSGVVKSLPRSPTTTRNQKMDTPKVAILMGSNSYWDVMKPAVDMLEKFSVPFEARVISAHRATDMLTDYVTGLRERGFAAVIAGVTAAKKHPAGTGCADPIEISQGYGLAAVHGTDAEGYPDGDLCDWRGGRCQCRAVCRKHHCGDRYRNGRQACCIPIRPGRGGPQHEAAGVM